MPTAPQRTPDPDDSRAVGPPSGLDVRVVQDVRHVRDAARPLRWYECAVVFLVIVALLWYATQVGMFGV